jgi:hypothetical protein
MKVLVAVLCGSERTNWINPQLSTKLIAMTHDTRAQVAIKWIYECRPTEYARNFAMDCARKDGVDWLLMIDNDVAPNDAIGVITDAPEGVDIIGIGVGLRVNQQLRLGIDATLPNPRTLGDFSEVVGVATACIAIRSTVWRKVSPPWFRWMTANDELRSPDGGMSEDIFFCKKAREKGFAIWTHRVLADHFKTENLTPLVYQVHGLKPHDVNCVEQGQATLSL